MTTIDVVVAQVSGLHRDDLERWIAHGWVRPDEDDAGFVFAEIDVARVQLIRDLRDDMKINEEALPVVLSLLDQLYATRRRMHDLADALRQTTPEDMRRRLLERLEGHPPGPS